MASSEADVVGPASHQSQARRRNIDTLEDFGLISMEMGRKALVFIAADNQLRQSANSGHRQANSVRLWHSLNTVKGLQT
ncbi:hypothetical protein P7K49_020027 [Saguinus oedipus]|uniref:Uncharacterized protein n=1 Tax=Saguinus oedipus TaxID=9490 RepID=A0ABQ9V030_SAGOE|nr:hypothetical protein P7K49_020027 [Saguinus oedipus]